MIPAVSRRRVSQRRKVAAGTVATHAVSGQRFCLSCPAEVTVFSRHTAMHGGGSQSMGRWFGQAIISRRSLSAGVQSRLIRHRSLKSQAQARSRSRRLDLSRRRRVERRRRDGVVNTGWRHRRNRRSKRSLAVVVMAPPDGGGRAGRQRQWTVGRGRAVLTSSVNKTVQPADGDRSNVVRRYWIADPENIGQRRPR